jgi:hypothetical protein
VKKFVLLFAVSLLLISSICYASPRFVVKDGQSSYYLQTEKVRFCSGHSGIFIEGQPNKYIEAWIMVMKGSLPANPENIFSMDKTTSYSETLVVFNPFRPSMAPLVTIDYNFANQTIGSKDATVTQEWVFVGKAVLVNNSNGSSSTHQDAVNVSRRTIGWIEILPGSTAETLFYAINDYAQSNWETVMAAGRNGEYMKITE